MLYKDTIFSVPATEVPTKKGINPQTNFLLKRAQLLSSIRDETDNDLSLYKLHSGIFVVLTKYKSPLRSDSMVRVELYQVADKFGIKTV
jgi:hypothetical protein